LLLGSVTAKVLHDVTCPVLTSAHEPQPTLTASDGLQSILCAVALSSQSDAVFRAAGFLAQAYGARICLLHIEPSPGENCLPTVPEEIVRSYERALDSDREKERTPVCASRTRQSRKAFARLQLKKRRTWS
jgi:hypothetical protein